MEALVPFSGFSPESVFQHLDLSPSTLKDYQYYLGQFIQFVEDRGLDRDIFLDYKRWLDRNFGFTVSTKNKYLTVARIFLRELHRQGMIPFDVTLNIHSFKQSKKHKRDGLTDDELCRLVDYLTELPNSPQNSRIRCLVGLLLYQGLRQVEIFRLDYEDLDLAHKTMFVRGKGRDDPELIDLHPNSVKLMRQYLKTNTVRSGPLFRSNSRSSMGTRLTTRGLRKIVTDVLRKCGIDKNVHSFRHRFTTQMIRNFDGSLLDVCTYTRHKTVDTLMIYYDRIKKTENLPEYYKAFAGVGL